MDCVFGVESKKKSLYPRSFRFSPMLFSKSLLVLCFKFWFMIHFELIFVKGVKSVFRFILFCMDVHLFLHHLLKSLSFLYCTAFAPLSKISWLYLWASISGLSNLFHWSICLPFHQYHSPDSCSFIVSLEVGSVGPPSLFFNIVLANPCLLFLHVNIRIRLFISVR